MKEDEIERLTIEDVEGTLSEKDQQEWESFLDQHPRLRKEVEEMRELHQRLRALPAPSVEAERLERIKRNVIRTIPHSSRRYRHRVFGALGLAAAILLTFLVSQTSWLPSFLEKEETRNSFPSFSTGESLSANRLEYEEYEEELPLTFSSLHEWDPFLPASDEELVQELLQTSEEDKAGEESLSIKEWNAYLAERTREVQERFFLSQEIMDKDLSSDPSVWYEETDVLGAENTNLFWEELNPEEQELLLQAMEEQMKGESS